MRWHQPDRQLRRNCECDRTLRQATSWRRTCFLERLENRYLLASDPFPTPVSEPVISAFESEIRLIKPQSQTLVRQGSIWKYLDDGSDQTAWTASAFDDSGWSSGRAQMGYGDGDEATVVSFGSDPFNKHVTTYFRREFAVTDTANINALNLTVKRDDGVAVYLLWLLVLAGTRAKPDHDINEQRFHYYKDRDGPPEDQHVEVAQLGTQIRPRMQGGLRKGAAGYQRRRKQENERYRPGPLGPG